MSLNRIPYLKALYFFVNVNLAVNIVNLCLLYAVLQTKPDCVNVYCYKYIFIFKFCFFFILLRLLVKTQFFIFFGFYIDFTWICLLFYGKYLDSLPRKSDSSRQTQPLPVHSREPYWSLYAQLIMSYPVHCPRSLIHLSRLNHHLGSSGFL